MPVDVSGLRFRRATLNDSDFSAGRDNDNSLSAGTVGEIGTSEVGEDASIAQYEAVQLGQPASNQTGDRKGNEVYVNLHSSTNAATVPVTAEFSIQARNKGELGGGAAGNISGWIRHRGQNNNDPAQRKPLFPQQPVVPRRRILSLQAKDENTSIQPDVTAADTVIEIPILGGK